MWPPTTLPLAFAIRSRLLSLISARADAQFCRFAFGGHPFNIEIFLEPADGSGCDYRRDYVTNVYNFSRPAVVNGEEVCTNCSNLEGLDVRVSSYVPITPILNRLMQQGRLASLKKGDVEDLLKRLYWRVTMVRHSLHCILFIYPTGQPL